jgi:hypothetical protein
MTSETYVSARPIFVTLKAGEKISGIFLGTREGRQFGIAYRLRTLEGDRYLGSGRAQLDDIFSNMMLDEEHFSPTLQGHYLIVERLADEPLKSGRTVAVYRVTHDRSGCLYGCTTKK